MDDFEEEGQRLRLSRNCPICENPESICPCPTYGGEALARDLVRKAEEVNHGKVMIRREDFLVLCDRAFAWGQQQSAAALRSERMKKAFLSGVLAALDHLIGITHDEPVIAAEIVRAVGARDLMLLAKEQDYPFLKQLRNLYRKENIEW